MSLTLGKNLTPAVKVESRYQFGGDVKTFALELGLDRHCLNYQDRHRVLTL